MRSFEKLFEALDATTKTSARVGALAAYFRLAPPGDAAWVVHFLTGGKMSRLVNTRLMREWVAEAADVPPWLLEECYAEAGDLAETLARLWPRDGQGLPGSLQSVVEECLLPLKDADEGEQRARLESLWNACGFSGRLLLNKFITGGFRMGVARGLVARGVAEASGLDSTVIEHRLAGEWEPTAAAWEALTHPDKEETDASRPYPFYLASPLAGPVAELGDPFEWQVEWKWDGIRAQLICRGGQVVLWSRGGELITDGFPEIAEDARHLPDGTVLDGELLAWRDENVMSFGDLQRRINRKNPGPKLRSEVPVVFMVYDCLEVHGVDIRHMPLYARVGQAVPMFGTEETPCFRVSEPLKFRTWEEAARLRDASRERGVEGLMLKRADSPYKSGRKRGDWWKWKVDPFTLDAVMVYAQAGHGRRAGVYTDYTFALRDGEGGWVSFAKAYSGLTDREMDEVDRFIRAHTLEKHGPVRVVEPLLVCEVAFEGLRESKRHKSGIAVRFPRVSRLRKDKTPDEADDIHALRALMRVTSGGEVE